MAAVVGVIKGDQPQMETDWGENEWVKAAICGRIPNQPLSLAMDATWKSKQASKRAAKSAYDVSISSREKLCTAHNCLANMAPRQANSHRETHCAKCRAKFEGRQESWSERDKVKPSAIIISWFEQKKKKNRSAKQTRERERERATHKFSSKKEEEKV